MMRFRMNGCGPRGGFDGREGMFAMMGGPFGGGGRGFGGGGFGGPGGGWNLFGGDWSGGPGGRGGGRGGRRGGMFRGGELRLVLLAMIAQQPRHGYDLIQSIEEMTGGDYAPSPGVVYPTLTMLEDMGQIAAQASEGSSRKAYAITPEGQAHLGERREEADALIARLTELGARQQAGGAPVRRAVANLLSALWHRVQSEGMTDENLHQIAEILDEAARKVERL